MLRRGERQSTTSTAGASLESLQQRKAPIIGSICLFGAIVLLSACGGGGGGDTGAVGTDEPSDPGTTNPGTPTAGTTTYLAVRAVDFSGLNGPYSQELSARLQPGQAVTLTWQAPNTTMDGQGCTSVAEYVVSLGPESAEYTEHVIVRTSSTALLCEATGTNSCGDVYTCELDFTVPSV
jgi:hypothetical protein